MQPVFGLNKGPYSTLPCDAYRAYNGPSDGVPASWPGPDAGPVPVTARFAAISIRPDIPSVLAGTLDAAITSFARTIPYGQVISAWAEGEAPRFGFKPQDLVDMHERMYRLIKSVQPSCIYMQITEGYSARHGNIRPFIFPYADAYGFDGYPEKVTDRPDDVFGPCIESVPYGVPFGITETNSMGAHQNLPDQPGWYMRLWDYAQRYGMICYMAFGGKDVALTPDDFKVLDVIRQDSERGLLIRGAMG